MNKDDENARRLMQAVQLGYAVTPNLQGGALFVFAMKIPNFGAPRWALPFELPDFPEWTEEGIQILKGAAEAVADNEARRKASKEKWQLDTTICPKCKGTAGSPTCCESI